MLRNTIGPSFDSTNVLIFFFWLVFFKISFSLQKEEDFWKTKKRKKLRKNGPSFDSKKAIFGPSFDSTAYVLYVCSEVKKYIYTYIYAVELKIGPRFGRL